MSGGQRAPIAGITDHDGQHLSEFLDTRGYGVLGLTCRHRNARREAIETELPLVHLVEADLTDPTSLLDTTVRDTVADLSPAWTRSPGGTPPAARRRPILKSRSAHVSD